MAVDRLLRIDGIDGASSGARHHGAIERRSRFPAGGRTVPDTKI